MLFYKKLILKINYIFYTLVTEKQVIQLCICQFVKLSSCCAEMSENDDIVKCQKHLG